MMMEWVKVTDQNCMSIVDQFEGVDTERYTNEHAERVVFARGDDEKLTAFINENIRVNHLDQVNGQSCFLTDFCGLLFELGNGISIEINNAVHSLLEKGHWGVTVRYPEGDDVFLGAKSLSFTLPELLAAAEKYRHKQRR